MEPTPGSDGESPVPEQLLLGPGAAQFQALVEASGSEEETGDTKPVSLGPSTMQHWVRESLAEGTARATPRDLVAGQRDGQGPDALGPSVSRSQASPRPGGSPSPSLLS